MPAKNTIKTYVENGYYHIYNRGVDKREIFLDEQDCTVFFHYLKLYLSPPEELQKDQYLTPKLLFKINKLNLNKEIDLLSLTLMPNHFHLQVKQHTKNGIEKLTRRLLTSYVQYFNRKRGRVGTLFESAYKAVLIKTDEQNLYLSSYIHRNPMKLKNPNFEFIKFSSYPYYLGHKYTSWIKPDEILSNFKERSGFHPLSYQNFVESPLEDPKKHLKELMLDADDEDDEESP